MSTDTDTINALAAQLAVLSDPIAAARAQLDRPVPIREWVETYLVHLARKTESECTPVNYASTLRLFTEHVEAHGSKVSEPIIQSFLESRSEFGRGANPANTWNRHLSTIRSMFNHLVAKQMQTGCPTIYREQALAVERLNRPITKAHPLAPVDWMAVWNSDLTMDERFWLGFGYFAGLRRFEVASLTVGVIDVEARTINHTRRKGKGERRFGDVPYGLMASLVAQTFPDTVGRNVDLWFRCVERVVATRGPDPETLLCVRMDDRNPKAKDRFKWVNDDWNALCRKYGVTTHYKLHDLRDSCSTNLSNVPGLRPDDRMRWMAHVDKATNDLYTRYDDDHALALLT